MTDYARIAGNLRRIAARNEYDQLSDRKDTSTEWHAANALETLIRERDEARAENERLRTALECYGEQARLAKLIHAEGDLGRHRLAKDGGDRARAELERKPE
jgi:hypothetical protein